ncbi:MAG: glycosyltransferase family 2 protein [Solirubrobacteraceae bacterium]
MSTADMGAMGADASREQSVYDSPPPEPSADAPLDDASPPDRPLVSIGIPTYSRAEKLERAVGSVLGQTYANLEVVISDNASDDGTEAFCRALCEREPRVRYLRSQVNLGPTANFNTVIDELRGDYAMLLSDDDWLDPDYVATCLAELRRAPGLVLACGIGRYLRDDEVLRGGVEMRLEQSSAPARVVAYVRDVDENGLFYGLMARSVMRRAAPLRNVLGNDWLLAAAIAAQGKATTLTGTSINRELDGTSADFAKLCATLGLPGWQARIPHLVIASQLIADIGWRAPAYRDLGPLARARLACEAAWAAIRWRSLIWHMTTPSFAALRRRRGGRQLWSLYLWLARRAGGSL